MKIQFYSLTFYFYLDLVSRLSKHNNLLSIQQQQK